MQLLRLRLGGGLLANIVRLQLTRHNPVSYIEIKLRVPLGEHSAGSSSSFIRSLSYSCVVPFCVIVR